MKKAMIKVLSLAMALTLVASLAACGGSSDEETTTSAENTTVGDVVPGDDVSADGETPADESTEPATDASGNTVAPAATQKPGEPTKAPANPGKPNAPADKTSLTNEEAVALFNKATVGKAKAGQRYTKVNLIEVPGGNTLKSIISKFLPDANKGEAISKPANTTMSVSDFSSISSKKSGNNWVITLKVKDGAAPATKAFDELPKNEIDDWLNNKLNVKPADGVKFNYSNGTIVVTVTPDGALVSGTYTMHVDVTVKNVTAAGFVKVDSAHVAVTQTDKF